MDLPPISRLVAYAIGIAVAIDLFVRVLNHPNPPTAASVPDTATITKSAAAGQPPNVPVQLNESQILAACHPHLSSNAASVPNIYVGDMPNPAGSRLKVRFWVNGDGFVTQTLVDGFTSYPAADQETALDYIKVVTFVVPNTPECHSRKMEMSGLFLESRSSIGEWETILDLYPRYSLDGNRVVVRR